MPLVNHSFTTAKKISNHMRFAPVESIVMKSQQLLTLFIIFHCFLTGHCQRGSLKPCLKFPEESSPLFWANNSHCYYFMAPPRESREASKKCTEANMHLVTFESVEEFNFLTHPNDQEGTWLPPDKDIWTGLVKKAQSAYHWVWEDTDGLQSDEKVIGELLTLDGVADTVPNVNAVLKNGELLVRKMGRPPPPTFSSICEDDNPSEVVVPETCTEYEQFDLTGVLYDSKNMKCFYVFNNLTTWDEARQGCEAVFGARLVFLEGFGDTRWLSNELNARTLNSMYWIGLTFNPTASFKWNWVTRFSSKPMGPPQFLQLPRHSSIYAYLKPSVARWGDTASDKFRYICEENVLNTNLHSIVCEESGPNRASFYLHSSLSCYFLTKGRFSFPDAKSICEANKGHMVSLASEEEEVFVQTLVQQQTGEGHNTWTGLVFDAGWKWDKGSYSTPLDTVFSGWREPSAATPTYKHVVLSPSGWIQAPPTESHHVVCQQPIRDSLTVAKRVCPFGPLAFYVYFSYTFRSCYHYYESPKDFNKAKSLCEMNGGHIFVPETADEQEEVTSVLVQNGLDTDVWLGLQRPGGGLWVWLYKDKNTIMDTIRFPSLQNSLPPNVRLHNGRDILQTQPQTIAPLLCEQSIDVSMLHNAARVMKAERDKSKTDSTPEDEDLEVSTSPTIIQGVDLPPKTTTPKDVGPGPATIKPSDPETTTPQKLDPATTKLQEIDVNPKTTTPQETVSDQTTTASQESGVDAITTEQKEIDVDHTTTTTEENDIDSSTTRPEEVGLGTTTSPPQHANTACLDPLTANQIQDVHYKRVDQLNDTISNLKAMKQSSHLACSKECSKSPFCFLYVMTSVGICWTFQRSVVSEPLNAAISDCSVNKCFKRICKDTP